MAREVFDLSFSNGFARTLHERALGDIEHEYPWQSLDPSRYPPLLLARARVGWTENAFNEFCTAAAMGQMLQALVQARAPLDLIGMASRFAIEEVLHVELCARMAMRLGGGAPIHYDPEDIVFDLDPSLTPLERSNELVVRLCCVGEALSFPLLSGAMRSASHPLSRSILETIVRDEAHHGNFGFLYLDWIRADLRPAERDRLGKAARQTLDAYRSLWERGPSHVVDGVTSEGFLLEHVRELGWMEASAYAELARVTIEESVRAPLARVGISL
ncbi:ferritin-like domain-containing protein [Polyangium fumosum]|uniref:Ferritin-like domain-containing protein n=1 Tax=Polyangium fumosum TaxID=889272 RepID=A0A4U1JEZ9_9BACT|nr:ferritin-like domain-containing protein [Polyangium fumosum]TKD08436.1 ferritin-like domain-containing protein [Polyangium fumosum]